MTTPAASIEFHDVGHDQMAIHLVIDGHSAELCQLKVGELSFTQKSAFMVYQQIVMMANQKGAVLHDSDRRMN